MRGPCLTGAVLVVLATNGWAIWQSTRNQAEPAGGTLRLTERELPLQPIALESSVTVLRINWRTDRIDGERFGPAAWLDRNKLAELGFDCTMPVQSPQAPRHYGAMPARRVFLALESQVPAAEAGTSQDARSSGLVVVDAAQDAQVLRHRYPDQARYAICRGSIRLILRRHDSAGRLLAAPSLAGWVKSLAPAAIYVRRPVNRLLTTLHRTMPEDENLPRPPRFTARVHWGKNLEPWIDEVQ